MQSVFESDLGIVEVDCPWCYYSLHAQVVVSEQQTAEMFFKLKAAYERLLFLQHYDAERINEITKLDVSIAGSASEVCRGDSAAYACCGAAVEDCIPTCCGATEDEQHFPI